MNKLSDFLANALKGFVELMTALIVLEVFAWVLDIPHAVKPKGRLARLLYVSETARVPILVGIAVLLSPLVVADKLRAKLRK